jgi:hypothetical protein
MGGYTIVVGERTQQDMLKHCNLWSPALSIQRERVLEKEKNNRLTIHRKV